MKFTVGNFDFTKKDTTVVIAEVGVNHNGNMETAKEMIKVAKKAGVDIIKFQAFKSEKEISKFAAKAPYQKKTRTSGNNQLEMCKALELSEESLRRVKKYCDKINMPFLCAAFDYDSLDFIVDDLKLSTVKIASSEVTNIPFLKYIGSKKKSVVFSTGASTISEVGMAIESLKRAGCPEMILLHCVSNYPAPTNQINLRAMQTMSNTFKLPVGFSDHTRGIETAIAAASLGAVAIEKHFTLDRTMPGPDHQASIEPDELALMVKGIKIANHSLGNGIKEPAACELETLPLIRRSIVASRNLHKGTKITPSMLEIKRPLGGIDPADLDKIIGLVLINDVVTDAPITWQDLRK